MNTLNSEYMQVNENQVKHNDMIINGKEIQLYPAKVLDAPLVILNTVHGEGQAVCEALKQITIDDFSLAAIGGLDWNIDMSPWAAPATDGKSEPFCGGADAYLHELTDEILPQILLEQSGIPKQMILAGYSLAGLFAVYSMYRTDVFDAIVSVSGSFWFPGFVDFVKDTPRMNTPGKLYFSLGDKEANSKNEVMRNVRTNTECLAEWYRHAGIDTVYELNTGGHFREPDVRMAKGIAAVLT